MTRRRGRPPKIWPDDDGPGPMQKPLAQPVNRDACPRCGARGDLGCKHRRPMDPPPRLVVKPPLN